MLGCLLTTEGVRLMDRLHSSSSTGWLSTRAAHELADQLDIPVPTWQVVTDPNEAVAAADRIGHPVALKADSGAVVHKSDVGAVALNLPDAASVRAAYARISEIGDGGDVSVLVQQMVTPDFELILGTSVDPTFDRVVMVGAGGKLVELLDDVSFRVGEIDLAEAKEMLCSLRARRLFDGYRGAEPIDITPLAELLVRLSRLDVDDVMPGARIVELEINPLAVADAQTYAVDLRARLAGSMDLPEARLPVPDLDGLFRPASVAMIGASRRPTMSHLILRHLIDYGYSGKLIPVNGSASGERIHGVPVAAALTDVEEPVDYGIVAVPATAVAETLRANAGRMQFAHVITSGFAEEGEQGQRLQTDLLDAARDAGVRVVGPNCLGLHSTAGGLTFVDGLERSPGNVSVVSQSGGLGADILRQGQAHGVRIGKLVTVGNAVDLTSEDFLEYLCDDPDTGVIGLYLEGTNDGMRLVELLQRAGHAGKPVVLLHGGRSAAGAQAVASHTGALAGEDRLWRAMAAQAGTLYPDSLAGFVSALAGAVYLRPTVTGRVLLLGPSGGMSVLASDKCARLGLDVPSLAEETRDCLDALDVPPGSSLRNPIDTPAGALAVGGGDLVPRIARTVLAHEQLDYVVIHLNVQNALTFTNDGAHILRNVAAAVTDLHAELVEGGEHAQVVFALRRNGEPAIAQTCLEIARPLWERGVPAFVGLEDALDAVQAITQIGRYRQRLGLALPTRAAGGT